MGHCLLVYDISHDRTRTKVSDICLDYGLDRIQYSAFMGTLMKTHQEELMLKLERQLGGRAGNIQLWPICAKDWAQRQVIDHAEDSVEVQAAKAKKPAKRAKKTKPSKPQTPGAIPPDLAARYIDLEEGPIEHPPF